MRELILVDKVLSEYWGHSSNRDQIIAKVRACMVDLLGGIGTIGGPHTLQIDKYAFVILHKALLAKDVKDFTLTEEEKSQFPDLNEVFNNEKFIVAGLSINILCRKSIVVREAVIRIQNAFSVSCLGFAVDQEMKIRNSSLIFRKETQKLQGVEIKNKLIGQAEQVCQDVRSLRERYKI